MDNIFVIAAIISVIFIIAKFLEMRFIEKESKPLKLLISILQTITAVKIFFKIYYLS